MFIRYNPNPSGQSVGDCVVRALTLAFKDTWENIYADITMVGAFEYNMPDANKVWGKYLKMNGFIQKPLPDTCPDCYTIKDFCEEHPYGTFVVATGSHVVAVIDGNYYDTSDSGFESPIYYFEKEK